MSADSDIYEQAWRGAVTDPRRWPAHRLIRRYAREPVVEVGPGLFPRSAEPDTTYVEPVLEAVERLGAAGLSAVQGEMAALPFADGAVGTVVAFDVLEHVPDDRLALAEVARVLAPGGRLILAVPCGPRYFSRLDVLVGHTFRYVPEALLAALDAAGFAVEVGRWHRPVWPAVKRVTDALQARLVARLGMPLAMRLRRLGLSVVPGFVPAASLGPLRGPPPRDASRATLVCRLG